MDIGIIIPCLNEERYVGKLLLSLQNALQFKSYLKNFRIFICDNGSSDNTVDILQSFSSEFHSLTILEETSRGPGLALKKAAETAFEYVDWVVVVDADCTLPIDFVDKWVKAINNTSLQLLTGYFNFDDLFDKDFPNALSVVDEAVDFINYVEELFGKINICGANHAVAKDLYITLGGYSQPYFMKNNERIIIAGNDWDLGVKARAHQQEVGFVNVFNITSDRRAAKDIKSFLLGSAYEGAFDPIRERSIGSDLKLEEKSDVLIGNKLRTVKHYALKPILVDNKLLSKEEVINTLGEKLISQITSWKLSNGIKDITNDRNGFIYGTLEDFNKDLGEIIYEKVNNAYER